jgi:hypothetical protein
MQINRPMDQYDPETMPGVSYASVQKTIKYGPAFPLDAVDANGFSVFNEIGKHHEYNPDHVNCTSCEAPATSLAKLAEKTKFTKDNINSGYNAQITNIQQDRRTWLRPFGQSDESISKQIENLINSRNSHIEIINKEYEKQKEYLFRPKNKNGKHYWFNQYEKKYVEYETSTDKLKQQLEASNKAFEEDQKKQALNKLLQEQAAYPQAYGQQAASGLNGLFGSLVGISGQGALGSPFSAQANWQPSQVPLTGDIYAPAAMYKEKAIPTVPTVDIPVIETSNKRKFKETV